MKIAIVTNGILPVPDVKGGGVETLITQYINENEKTGTHEIVVFSIYDAEAKKQSKKYNKTKFVFLEEGERNILDRIKYRLFGKYSLNAPYSYKKVINDIKNNNFERVIIENTTWPLSYASKQLKNKLYFHLHNDWINENCEPREQKMFIRAINNMNKVVVVSEFIKNRICTIKDIQPNKIEVLKNCTNIELFNNTLSDFERIEIRKQYGVSKEDILLIFAGRICWEKGLLPLVKSINRIPDDIKVKLIIAGSAKSGEEYYDDYTQDVINAINESEKDIQFSGFIPHKELRKMYASSDIAIVPSVWDDPAPLTIFETMASGLPIITTYSGGIPEYANTECAIFCHKDDRLVAELSNAIKELCEDENKRNSMSLAAKKRSKEFTTKHYYDDFNNILLK